MARFSAAEIDEINEIWRSLPASHSWTGWGVVGVEPSTVWLYRQRENWRRFLLTKTRGVYSLADENGEPIGASDTLTHILYNIETAPGLPKSDKD